LLDLVRLNINLKVKKGRISKLDLKKELKRSNEQDCPENASKIFSFMLLTRRLSRLDGGTAQYAYPRESVQCSVKVC
jgi:hypothetical protein